MCISYLLDLISAVHLKRIIYEQKKISVPPPGPTPPFQCASSNPVHKENFRKLCNNTVPTEIMKLEDLSGVRQKRDEDFIC